MIASQTNQEFYVKNGWNIRVITLICALAMAFSLLPIATIQAHAAANDIPGTALGPSGASGFLDEDTKPQDVYAVYLFRGQEVGFKAATVDENVDHYARLGLYTGGTLFIDQANRLASTSPFGNQEITYTPAVSGIYYLEVYTYDNGVSYSVSVTGTEAMPQRTSTSLSTSRKIILKGKKLFLSGKVSSAAPSGGTVKIVKQYFVNRKWKTVGTAASVSINATTKAYSYTYTPKLRGKWRFIAKYTGRHVGTVEYVSSKSSAKTVTVK